jgi:hypothetical protein
LHGSAHKEEVVAEEIVDVTGTVALDVAERSASNAINLDTSHVSARKIKIFATVAMVLDTLQKTVSRSVCHARLRLSSHEPILMDKFGNTTAPSCSKNVK